MEKIFPTFSTLSFLPSYVPANLISNEKNSFSQFPKHEESASKPIFTEGESNSQMDLWELSL